MSFVASAARTFVAPGRARDRCQGLQSLDSVLFFFNPARQGGTNVPTLDTSLAPFQLGG